ncbi:hypothetical protein CEXT_48541 [Caerostris extrusa]|uniref:Uncharacterized protein n=1 Tax=Caerostris extrusa TaxID=172846 RepID=A0AAV4N3W8_CAEEX|nr:hypothetical protein CEXT_48541 [Caerostris extrusa]
MGKGGGCDDFVNAAICTKYEHLFLLRGPLLRTDASLRSLSPAKIPHEAPLLGHPFCCGGRCLPIMSDTARFGVSSSAFLFLPPGC